MRTVCFVVVLTFSFVSLSSFECFSPFLFFWIFIFLSRNLLVGFFFCLYHWIQEFYQNMPRFVPFLIDLAWNTVNSFNLQSFSICNLFLAQGIFLLLLIPPSKILVIDRWGQQAVASLWNGPFPNQWPRDSGGTKAQTIPSASLESSSLGTVRGETHLNSNSKRGVLCLLLFPPLRHRNNPIQQKDFLSFPPTERTKWV